MIRLNDIRMPLDYNDDMLKAAAAKMISVDKKKIKSLSVYRRSIDARKKDNVCFNFSVDVALSADEGNVLRRCKNSKVSAAEKYYYEMPQSEPLALRPVVVGAGPAGLFASLILAKAGQMPILIERGKSVEQRTHDVEVFGSGGRLDTESNVQFGEGGAGTFSDGKLNTGTKDIRSRKVLEEFVSHGAPEDILINAKPHIGTDKLKITVKNIRDDIIKMGGEVRFETKLTGIRSRNGSVYALEVESGGSVETIETDNVILAIGHSARDTFKLLYDGGFAMQAKPFSVGVRIEHLQENINKAQFGKFYNNKRLGAADYKLNVHLKSGRGVYTFCMCPGGSVVAAASEENTVVTNGMSEYARDKTNANSAVLVGVNPDDFSDNSPLAGVEFQRKIERAAFVAGGENYGAPVQRVGDLIKGRKSKCLGEVKPSYTPGYRLSEVSEYLPEFVCDSLREAIPLLDRRISGFANGDAVVTGAETRSSSPVRILRGDSMEAVSMQGVYPCGEGAGYAGGIVSAAVDGIKCAEAILMKTIVRN